MLEGCEVTDLQGGHSSVRVNHVQNNKRNTMTGRSMIENRVKGDRLDVVQPGFTVLTSLPPSVDPFDLFFSVLNSLCTSL